MVHLHYPSMERQDLTQGQLGSFKFTPVDDNQFFSPPLAFQTVRQKVPSPRQNRKRRGDSQMNFYFADANPTVSHEQVKPDPNITYQRLSPAVIDTAVEDIAISPSKQSATINTENFMQPNAESFLPLPTTNSSELTWPLVTFASNSIGSRAPNTSQNERGNVTKSLLYALETEQQAHQNTKLILKAEVTKREAAESEVRQVVENNKSLLNSIKLLQSTVRHMVNRDSRNINTIGDSSKDRVYPSKSKECQMNSSHSILQNATQQQRSQANDNDSTAPVTVSFITPLDEALLLRPALSDDFSKAQLQRELERELEPPPTLRKPAENSMPHIPSVDAESVNFGGIPDVIDQADDKSETDQFAARRTEDGQPSQPEGKHSPEATSAAPNIVRPNVRSGILLENGSLFMVPEHVISKYNRRDTQDRSNSVLTEGTASDHESEISPSASWCRDSTLPQQVGSPTMPDKNNQLRLSSGPELRWNPSLMTDPNFHRHVIRYVPSMAKPNIFRTVMIDLIPPASSYGDLLPHIRGGTLESIHLYEPIGSTTDFLTARVVFTHEHGAKALYQHGQNFGIMIKGKKVRVWRVQEPSYQRKVLQDAIYEQGYTRLLVVDPPDISVMDKIPEKLKSQFQAGFVIDISEATDGTPMIEFTSVEEAWKALDILMMDEEFGGTHFDFE